MSALFWISAGLLLHTYLLYPLLLAVIASISRSGSIERPAAADDALPAVAVVLSAFNEQAHILERISNLREQDYPHGKLRIYVGSDGSTDRTAAILAQLQGPDLRAFVHDQRRGKASVLNDIMAAVEEPFTVFTDANVLFESRAIRQLVGTLLATDAGAVCGELQLQSAAGDNQDALYWRLERFLKNVEGRMNALLGANGAIYAIRTECFERLPPDTIVDDFVIAMRIAVGGRALVYDAEARAVEDTPDNIEDEFRRRVRIGVGNYQAMFRYPGFLFKAGLTRGFCYVSHKVLRWLGPHLLIIMLLSSAALYKIPFYRALVWVQVLGYAGLLIANAVRSRHRLPRWLSGLVMLGGLNLAFAFAFWRYLAGDVQGQWSRTRRREAG